MVLPFVVIRLIRMSNYLKANLKKEHKKRPTENSVGLFLY